MASCTNVSRNYCHDFAEDSRRIVHNLGCANVVHAASTALAEAVPSGVSAWLGTMVFSSATGVPIPPAIPVAAASCGAAGLGCMTGGLTSICEGRSPPELDLNHPCSNLLSVTRHALPGAVVGNSLLQACGVLGTLPTNIACVTSAIGCAILCGFSSLVCGTGSAIEHYRPQAPAPDGEQPITVQPAVV